MSATSLFTLGNVPYVNARLELKDVLEQLLAPAFGEALRAGHLETMFWSWRGQPHELVTDLMRRSIIALESYVGGAVRITALNAGLWSDPFEQKLVNPFHLNGKRRGAADAYYNKVPALLSADFSLKVADNPLWTEVSAFYQHTRNPLFHGHMIKEAEIEPLTAAHQLIARVYTWIDSWSTY
jgi:hypothetical protein